MDRLLELLKKYSFEEREVVLSSGQRSTFFIDCKQTVLLAEGHLAAGRALLRAIDTLSRPVQAVAGVELGGCSLASAVSTLSAVDGRPLDAMYVRKELKDHGSGRWIEGGSHLAGERTVAVLEDVITTGGSTLRAVGRLNELGFNVIGVIALVDRCQGGKEIIAKEGLEFVSIYSRRDFLGKAQENA
ncbi:MAG: orotate phosphoribosyltransferase [Myxococcales bacterium]|nr:orotate phosphoribosyltransferase [Myxococcales bacterium]MCB9708754.1 orotate phosphoribosyltransferase [Myxococcales bacterium]